MNETPRRQAGDHATLFSTQLEEPAPQPFDFRATARSHGWVALAPFAWDDAREQLSRTVQLSGGAVVHLQMRAGQAVGTVQIEVLSAQPLPAMAEVEIRRAVGRMLRLDEDLSEFYRLIDRIDGRPPIQRGAGRLLRSPTLFEDIVYTLLTTNIAWSGTKRMAERLVSTLGEPLRGREGRRAFPSPDRIAAAGVATLRDAVRLGYRSPYVWELAARVASGELDLADFERPGWSTADLRRAVRRVKGVGEYAAATILMLLGHYDELAIDSEMRAFVSKKYFQGAPATDAQIREIYAPWGAWQYLGYWFDLVSP